MDGSQRHAFHGWGLLIGGAPAQLPQHPVEINARSRFHNLFNKPYQCVEGLPALAGLGTLRLGGAQAQLDKRSPGNRHWVIRQVLAAGRGDKHADSLQDFRAAEKALAAADLVDHSGVGKRLLKLLRLGIDAVKDGNLGGRHALIQQGKDLAGHLLGLNFFGLIGLEGGLWAGLAHALQLQARARRAAGGLANDPVGQVRYLRRRAVVALQLDHGAIRVRAREIEQIVRGGAVEGIDGLVSIAHHGKVIALAQPGVEHPLLQRGNILVLVDDKGAILLPESLCNRRHILDGTCDVHEEVIEVQVHHVRRGLGLLIAAEGLCHLGRICRRTAVRIGDHGLIILGADQRGLSPLDFRQDVSNHVLGIIQPHRAHRAGN